MLTIGSTAPNFVADSTEGEIKFYDWMGEGWCVFFSHPKDFTPVCTTELGVMAGLSGEFTKRNCKIIGISVDPVSSHMKWKSDIADIMGEPVSYPLIGDPQLKIAKLFGMLPADAGETSDGRTAADNATVRSVFIIGPDKKIKLALTYPMTTGRNFSEIIRVLDSLQLTADHKVATPANWEQGEDVIIVPSVPDEEARKMFPDGWTSPRPYMRVVEQPA
ncbi:MAG: peroxiredoxin [Pseudomonadota bacterium]